MFVEVQYDIDEGVNDFHGALTTRRIAQRLHAARVVPVVQQHDHRLIGLEILLAVAGISTDDEQITDSRLACRSAVERDLARTAPRFDDICVEALTVRDVVELDVLKLPQPRDLE